MEIPHVGTTLTTRKPKENLKASRVKPLKTKTVDLDEPGPSRAREEKTKISGTDSDCLCTDVCKYSYAHYTDDKGGICCVSCLKWVMRHLQSWRQEPSILNNSFICLIQFSEYIHRKAWLQGVTYKK